VSTGTGTSTSGALWVMETSEVPRDSKGTCVGGVDSRVNQVYPSESKTTERPQKGEDEEAGFRM
jgi:hypothetical protein